MTRPDFRDLAITLLVGLVAAGCGPSSGRSADAGAPTTQQSFPSPGEPGGPAPRVSRVTPEGVLLSYPVWLDHYPELLDKMLAEVRDVVPNADTRIAPEVRGVPAGTTLIVLDPGPYYAPYSPTLLASGEWRAPSTIYVAWRGDTSGLLLPALPHELRHQLTQDPLAGH